MPARCSLVARSALCGSIVASLASLGSAQTPPVGKWDPPLLWEYWIAERDPADPSNQTLLFEDCAINENAIVGQGNQEWELSHAAVIPTGNTPVGW